MNCSPVVATLQDDGDQRPLLGKAWQPVLDKMNDVGLKFGLYMSREPDQQLIRAMMTADISQLRAQFEPELLYYRALPNRLSMAALAVSLVQRLQMQMPRPEAIRRFTPVIGFWLDQGARINAKDIGGQTALHLAVMFDPILPLAEFLLQRGADINAQTRTGATPMLMSVQAFEVRAPEVNPDRHIAAIASPTAYVVFVTTPSSAAQLKLRVVNCCLDKLRHVAQSMQGYRHELGNAFECRLGHLRYCTEVPCSS